MTARLRLPNRRGSQTFPVICEGLVYRATVSHFDDGRLGEIFLSASKANSQTDSAARDAAIAASLALQYGAPLDVLRRALTRNADGKAASVLGAALDAIEVQP